MKLIHKSIAIAATLCVATGLPAQAEDESYHEDFLFGYPDQPTEAWILSRGGRLYDNWYETQGLDAPEDTHAAWPALNTKKSGAVTNRCKSCHGWDYNGAAGAYGSGSYETGITGVLGMAGADPEAITAVFRDATHGFTEDMISEREAAYLAAFISRGTDGVDRFVSASNEVIAGDADNGAAIYQTTCASCHGFDGKALDFSGGDTPEYVGTIAADNPLELLHKVRNGQPGAEMIAMRGLGDTAIADLMAYLTTLSSE